MKLKPGYVECCAYIPDTPCGRGGRFLIILTPDGHTWLREDAEDKHPECFEAEQKFQQGDLVAGKLGILHHTRLEYLVVTEGETLLGRTAVRDAMGRIYTFEPSSLKFISH